MTLNQHDNLNKIIQKLGSIAQLFIQYIKYTKKKKINNKNMNRKKKFFFSTIKLKIN